MDIQMIALEFCTTLNILDLKWNRILKPKLKRWFIKLTCVAIVVTVISAIITLCTLKASAEEVELEATSTSPITRTIHVDHGRADAPLYSDKTGDKNITTKVYNYLYTNSSVPSNSYPMFKITIDFPIINEPTGWNAEKMIPNNLCGIGYSRPNSDGRTRYYYYYYAGHVYGGCNIGLTLANTNYMEYNGTLQITRNVTNSNGIEFEPDGWHYFYSTATFLPKDTIDNITLNLNSGAVHLSNFEVRINPFNGYSSLKIVQTGAYGSITADNPVNKVNTSYQLNTNLKSKALALSGVNTLGTLTADIGTDSYSGGLEINGGTLNANGTVSVAGPVKFINGVQNGNIAYTMKTKTPLTFTSATISGSATFNGSAGETNVTNSNFTGATFSVNNPDVVNVSGSTLTNTTFTLNNPGTVTLGGSNLAGASFTANNVNGNIRINDAHANRMTLSGVNGPCTDVSITNSDGNSNFSLTVPSSAALNLKQISSGNTSITLASSDKPATIERLTASSNVRLTNWRKPIVQTIKDEQISKSNVTVDKCVINGTFTIDGGDDGRTDLNSVVAKGNTTVAGSHEVIIDGGSYSGSPAISGTRMERIPRKEATL